jgi:hypothetical protein
MEKKLAINRIKAVLAEKGISHKFQPTLKLLREIAFCARCGHTGAADPDQGSIRILAISCPGLI